MNIFITDNPLEMEEIGREIVKEKENIYQPLMIETIYNAISSNLRGASEQQKNSVFYRSIYDYWVYGNSIDEEFYYDFLSKTHKEKSEYITFRLREKYCGYLNQGGDRDLFVDKYRTYQRFKKYYLRDVIQIKSDEDYPVFEAFVKKHPSFVVKPKDMAFGVGVYLVKENDYSDLKELFEHIRDSGRKNHKEVVWAKNDYIVLEEIIEQDERFAVFHPESVNGIRLTTIKKGDKVEIFYPWFKVGANHNFVTSAVFGTMDAGIDSKTGEVVTAGFKENGESYEYHPNTGVRIVGFKIPKWDELVEIGTNLALSLEKINYVGWDFVLTPKGWCIMEANYDGDFMGQLFHCKGQKKELEELIGWKFKKDFWWQD